MRPTRRPPQEAIKFFKWAFEKGGKMAEELDYIPMPDSVVKLIEKTWIGRDQELSAVASRTRCSALSGARDPGLGANVWAPAQERQRAMREPTERSGERISSRLSYKYRGLAWQTWRFRAT